MAEFKMPSLGADMASGTLYEWLVQPGDSVKRGDLVAAVETDKGVIEIEVFEAGVVRELLVAEGTEVSVGTVIALIQAEGEPEPEAHPMDQPAAMREEKQPVVETAVTKPTPTPAPVPATNGHSRRRVSPLARKRAAELGVDMAKVEGSGPGGAITEADIVAAAETAAAPEKPVPVADDDRVRITPVARRMAADLGVDIAGIEPTGPCGAISRDDVVRAARMARTAVAAQPTPSPPAAPPPAPKPAEKGDFQAGMRRAIAAAMSRANRDIPHYYLETRIDMTKTLAWLEAENLKRSIKDRILPAVPLIKAVAQALRDVPALNGFWRDDVHQPQDDIHVGFAIALRQGGLVTPAIHHADRLDLDELMAALRDLIMRTRAGRLRGSEMTDATITVTSLGDLGVEKVYGVIYPPQVALVGFGKVMAQPWVENDMLGIRQVLTATIAGDHRATDGRVGAQFLEALAKHLQTMADGG